jgi:hypothetical protein
LIENPAQAAIVKQREEAKGVWQAVETQLNREGHDDLAGKVRDLLREAEKPITSMNQEFLSYPP